MAISDFADMMTDTVTHYEYSGRDAYGVPTYGSSADYTARVTFVNKLVRAKDGSQIVSGCQIWLLGSPTISPDDKITLSDGSSPTIITFEKFQDDTGAHHTKIYTE